jgi:hypothetical protein
MAFFGGRKGARTPVERSRWQVEGEPMITRDLPYQHLSIRVPWHDTGWAGTVCEDPINNASCLRLSRIAADRHDAREAANAGRPWAELDLESLPPCHAERGGFMSPVGRRVLKEHHPNGRSAGGVGRL